ncbi:hypothetical protein VB779_15600 [Haloarculaceae archaeon H-GB11]|nr:hypothetical protein [Haloarculaceae archaeon H-GB1-1]MEA5388319.1 hypothetical protein [Haloarculaceae archaeon H-GB11]
MEITITLDYGPLDVEFTGGEREELEENLIAFIEFLEEDEAIFGNSDFAIDQEPGEESPGLDPDYWESQQESTQEPDSTESSVAAISFGSIPNRTDIDEGTLDGYFDIDPEGEEPPYLNFDVDILGESGNSRSEKQMRGSLILMTLWREGNGIEEIGSSDLKDALRISGIDDESLYAMYGFNNDEGDRYFRRDGSGANTEITLTMPGEREGFDQIQRTVERLEGEVEE